MKNKAKQWQFIPSAKDRGGFLPPFYKHYGSNNLGNSLCIKNQFAQLIIIFTTITLLLFSYPSIAAEYGPVAVKETLWSIASRHRPSNAVTTQQVMLAIRRANPQAFQADNINTLKAGAMLRLPELNEIRLMGTSQALKAAHSENSAWNAKTTVQNTTYKQHYQASQRELAKLQQQLKREKQRVKVLKADIKALKSSEKHRAVQSSSELDNLKLTQKITDLEQLIEAKNVHIGQLENMKVVASETIKRQLVNNEMLFNKLKTLDPQAVINTTATTGSLELKVLDENNTANNTETTANASLAAKNDNNLGTWILLAVLLIISLFIVYVLRNMYIQYRLDRKMRSDIHPSEESQDTQQTTNSSISDRKVPQLGT